MNGEILLLILSVAGADLFWPLHQLDKLLPAKLKILAVFERLA
jgi:hypothetical protein